MTRHLRNRGLALLEAMAAFAVMHVGFRLIKGYTAWGSWENAHGMNFSPGFLMIAIAAPMLWWHLRRRPAGQATSPSGGDPPATPSVAHLAAGASAPQSLAASIVSAWACLLILFLLGGALLAAGISPQGSDHAWPQALVLSASSVGATWLLLWLLRRRPRNRQTLHTSAPTPPLAGTALLPRLGAAAFLVLLILPTLLALRAGGPVGVEALTTLWILLGAGLGEELFFRGYLQTRLNLSFGRPWKLYGVRFGPGLLLTSALFGMVHALNPVDYFQGSFDFAWQHGLMTASALYYGFLRERTGSILAPMMVHVVVNLGGLLMSHS